MNVPFGDLTREVKQLRAAIDESVGRVVNSGWFVLGPEVEEFENFTRLMKEVLFAITFLSLLLFRFIYMRSARAAMPQLDMPKSLILLARVVHLGMYVSLALIAITGLIIGGLYYFGVKDGLVLEAILLSHEIFFWTSVNLMGLHIAGAIYHRLQGDGVWSAMVPILKEEPDK